MKSVIIACILVSLAGSVQGVELVNMEIIKAIESSGDPAAFNTRSGARGLYQITDICRREYNNYHKAERIMPGDLFSPVVNERIARWYLNERIPQMLRYYGRAVTVENVLIAYNAGIAYVVEGRELPRETADYLRKYNERGRR